MKTETFNNFLAASGVFIMMLAAWVLWDIREAEKETEFRQVELIERKLDRIEQIAKETRPEDVMKRVFILEGKVDDVLETIKSSSLSKILRDHRDARSDGTE